MGRPKHAARERFERVFLARAPGVMVALMGALQHSDPCFYHSKFLHQVLRRLFIVIKLTRRGLFLAE